ncbi:O-acyltransferase [Cercospora zeina]
MSADRANGHATAYHDPQLHQPRARKALEPRSARDFDDEIAPKRLTPGSGNISGPGTPAPPDDAPLSVKATSAARKHVRRKTRQQRLFPSIEYEERVSHFDPRSSYGNFRGFFVLFWIGLAIMILTAMLRNLKETGRLLNFKQWPLFTKDLFELALSDAFMTASTALALPLNLLFMKSRGPLRWHRGGIVVQSVFQAIWLWLWVSWPFVRQWSWTAQVYFLLHTMALGFKTHSYAFYNGHLATTLQRLQELDQPMNQQTSTAAAVKYPHAYTRPAPGEHEQDEDTKDHHISTIMQLREDLATELTSPLGNVSYPQNLTLRNFAFYLMCPTLCYELEYPRTPSRSYLELFYKTLAVFGCIFLITVTTEEFILPVLDDSAIRLQLTQNWIDRSLIFAETVSSLLFPFMIEFLLVFLVIFEYVLGAFAELTRFGDRQFYSDWWNSTSWIEFSREWNKPVHHFFHRHVYLASRSVNISKPVATVLTFLISGLAHELIMGCITRKARGYSFCLLMLQIPICTLQQTPWFKRRELLNNILFWISMILGLSLVCALYVLV